MGVTNFTYYSANFLAVFTLFFIYLIYCIVIALAFMESSDDDSKYAFIIPRIVICFTIIP